MLVPVLQILTHPPIEQRTRTAKEKRLFKTAVRVHLPKQLPKNGSLPPMEVVACLLYADSTTANRLPQATSATTVNGILLGGTTKKQVIITKKLSASYVDVMFDDFNLNEPSSRHKDREFCVLFKLINLSDGALLDEKETTPCYAYSHPKVLKRRRDVLLKALSTVIVGSGGNNHHHPNIDNGDRMHAVGGPFIQSPRLGVVFRFTSRRKGGEVVDSVKLYARNLELFSDTVIFFDPPHYPAQSLYNNEKNNYELIVHVSVTNDSRHFSNSMAIEYVAQRNQVSSVSHNVNKFESREEKAEQKQLNMLELDDIYDNEKKNRSSLTNNNNNHNYGETKTRQDSLKTFPLIRRRKREDSIDGVSNSNDNEDGDHDGQDNVDMDPFLLPLSNGKRLFSLEDEGNNETFNFDESAWFQNGNFLGDSNSPFPWGDNVENTDYEDMNLGSLFHNESESTLDASILKPKRKRMRSRM